MGLRPGGWEVCVSAEGWNALVSGDGVVVAMEMVMVVRGECRRPVRSVG